MKFKKQTIKPTKKLKILILKKEKEIESDPIIHEVKQLFPNAEIKDIE